MMARSFINAAASALFYAALCLPTALGVLYGVDGDAPAPPSPPRACLAMASPKAFAVQAEAWFACKFSLRRQLISWKSRLWLAFFGESPVPNVRAGRNGWFFYTGERTMVDYEHSEPYSQHDLVRIGTVLEQRRKWLAARGIKFFVVVVPNKQTVYPEYLPPSWHVPGTRSRLEQVARYIKKYPDLEFIDLRQALAEAKRKRHVFYRTDSHWNSWGAFIGSRMIMQRVKPYFPAVGVPCEEDYAMATSVCHSRDLAEMLMLNNFLQDECMTMVLREGKKAVAGSRPYPNPATQNKRPMIVMERVDAGLPKALVFRDSFATELIPFLSESFQSTVFVWSFSFLPELIDREKPDVVILECVERYIDALQAPNPAAVVDALPVLP